MSNRPGVLFRGRKGVDLKSHALSLVRQNLCEFGTAQDGCTCQSCQTKLSKHPDFFQISAGENTLTVEDADIIVSKSSLVPVMAERLVFFVDGFDKFNAYAQNKLLLTLENCSCAFIGTSSTDVLDTVKSRMQVIEISPMKKEEWIAGGGDVEMYYITGGCPLLVEELLPYKELFCNIRNSFLANDPATVLKYAGLMKEKDTSGFGKDLLEYVPQLLGYLDATCCQWAEYVVCGVKGDLITTDALITDINVIVEKQRMIREAMENVNHQWFTKNELFDFLVGITTK